MDSDRLTAWLAAEELRASWQARLIVATSTSRFRVPSNELQAICLSIIAHSYDDGDQIYVLMRVLYSGFQSLFPPFVCSIAHIDKAGRVVANVLQQKDGFEFVTRNVRMYNSLQELQDEMRELADAVKLTDPERIEFFNCVQAWCPADHRRDPNFDPRDPDAIRLTVH